MADFPVNFAHLGTLFAVDTDRDGRITLKDLIDFAKMWASQQRNYERFDFQVQMIRCDPPHGPAQHSRLNVGHGACSALLGVRGLECRFGQARMQGQCTVKLCKFVLSDGGVDAFVEWFTKVVMGTREVNPRPYCVSASAQ
jgi:hypothetical protein